MFAALSTTLLICLLGYDAFIALTPQIPDFNKAAHLAVPLSSFH